MAATGPRRRKVIGHRRRVEDDGEDEAGLEVPDLDDDSLTDGSIGSDDNDPADDSDTSNIDEGSPTSPNTRKVEGNGAAKAVSHEHLEAKPGGNLASKVVIPTKSDTDIMLNGLSIDDTNGPVQEIDFDDVEVSAEKVPAPARGPPIAQGDSQAPFHERRRREHEEYRKKRDEDPAFVPNRGAFFMHDHRHAGPSANGFRPFGRGGARGRGRGGFGGGLYNPIYHTPNPSDPLANSPWTHDMHEVVAEALPARQARQVSRDDGRPNGIGAIRTAATSETPINRAMSTEKQLGTVTLRVFIPPMKAPLTFPGVALKQYTKLPDHRPPLRRDKPVRVSLPYHGTPIMPRYIFPATDRSFIFIPRALRPNQQSVRGRGPRSNLGSVGGFSRRTSVFGGSYYGSTYSPSVALSRRSSIAPDVGRDFIISPTGSAISRPPMPMDNNKVTVRLPPAPQPSQYGPMPGPMPGGVPGYVPEAPAGFMQNNNVPMGVPLTTNDMAPPQMHSLPQKPAFHENRCNSIPMHQPRPQKAVSVENIETPAQQEAASSGLYQSAFHQQVPPQVANSLKQETHSRRLSYPTRISTGTPLSQIPERAIHAAPFQPNAYAQPSFYGPGYPIMQPQPQPGYYYPQGYGTGMAPVPSTPVFVPGAQGGQQLQYSQSGPTENAMEQANGQASGASRLISQDIGGTMYYFDPSQLPAMASYPTYPTTQPYAVPNYGMGGMVAPSSDTVYYPQPAPGMVGGADYSQFNYQPPVSGMTNFSQ